MLKRPLFLAAIVLSFVIIGILRLDPALLKPALPFADGEEVCLEGAVCQILRKNGRVQLMVNEIREEMPDGVAKVTPSKDAMVPGKMLVKLQTERDGTQKIRIGNRILIRGKARLFEAARNFGNFEEDRYYASLGIFFQMEPDFVRVESSRVSVLSQLLQDLRDRLAESIQEAVTDEETAGLLTAICLGDRSYLSDESKLLWQNSGIAHVLAISGLHISLLGMTAFRLLRKRLRFLPSAAFSGLFMLVFCLMTGASPSAVRATIMFAVQLGAIGLGKTYDMLCSISLAGILMLLFHPLLVMHTGFQLSFAAVLGAAVFYPSLAGIFLPARKRGAAGKVGYSWFRKTVVWPLLSGFLMSLSITLATFPILAASFYEIPLYAILMNLLVIPMMSVVLGMGLASALFGLLHLLLGRFLAAGGVYLVQLIRWICQISGKFPGSRMTTGMPAFWRICIYYLLLICGAMVLSYMERKQQRFKGKDIWRIGAFLAFFILVLFLRFRSRNLRIFMLDVGQGESILLESPSGTVYMIDCGSTSVKHAARYRVSSALHYLGIHRIDYLILTHPDLDHMSGILEILESQDLGAEDPIHLEIGRIFTPFLPDNENEAQMAALCAEKGITIQSLHKGMRFTDGALSMTCLHPEAGFSAAETNAYSAVMDIRFQDFSFLAVGDLGAEGEAVLLQDPDISWPEKGYSLLKVGHHGSSTSTSEAFLRKVSPMAAIISAGVNNRYGHPHEETLKRLTQADVLVFCTSQCGEILLQAQAQGTMQIRTKIVR